MLNGMITQKVKEQQLGSLIELEERNDLWPPKIMSWVPLTHNWPAWWQCLRVPKNDIGQKQKIIK